MKGEQLLLVLMVIIIASGQALGNPALNEPCQGEEYVNTIRASGTGTVDIATSIVDKRIALEYYNVLYGTGDFEMDSQNQVSTSSGSIQGQINGSQAPLNLLDNTRMTFSGTTPLVGFKSIKSRAFYGGIGAEVQESFAVTEMERNATAFFASTAPASGAPTSAHLVGVDSKNSFNGTWQTDASWHKIFYKDISTHESFTGVFEVEKLLKFHENPVSEPVVSPCASIDC
ncbi:MAG: hypothetical protein JW986_07730 [Methanotrichaceae archaeon]|nr:hypothetical protein [Methanotrichaceae archaeon]